VHQPLRAYYVAFDLHFQRRLGDTAASERRFVDEYDVREVENVVDQQLIVGLDVKQPVNASPARCDVLAKVGDAGSGRSARRRSRPARGRAPRARCRSSAPAASRRV
jgi:hypothetical protein